ncbi:TIGR02391 family protein [Paenibacillus sp. ISL-20]|uniref:TIGR02391 family protein n=1 Tax=Paenibacillus sp. ISL-20 TaxID=2819163 RepID=UPI001BED0608|nr:TIGR02391 family protein [Paenibacillus sp. ISL-20]MBT2765916.1 TIGR02391 family protein [Paenibacillus sp. ISL-20]
MTSKIQCPLCGKDAVQIRDRSEVYLINCQSCGNFQITRECLDDLPAEKKLRSQLIKVSAFTRYRTINKESVATLFISDPDSYSEGYSIQQVVDQFPSVPERKLKVLQNLKCLSKYWGDTVSIDRKDYAVFFPEANEEQPSLMMMRTLVEEGLVSGAVKFPTQLTVTEKGHSLLRELEATITTSPSPKAPALEETKTRTLLVQPSILEGLHPRVLEVAQKLFQDGHFRSAVLDTYVALDNDVQKKSHLPTTGKPLMDNAFSKNSPILKLSNAPDAQLGAMLLFSGAAMGVRNVLAHDQKANPSEQEALELLYFASTLFRRLDLAVNVEAEKLMEKISQLKFTLDGTESSLNCEKLRAYLAPSREYVDSALHRLCFLQILEIIKSGYFNDQNAGINLLLEWNAAIFDHITYDDHIELITYIYKAAGYTRPSQVAEGLIRDGFKPITKSLKLFQENLLFSTEVFREVLKKVWWEDAFFKSIVNYADLEFLVPFLNKVVDKEFELTPRDVNNLSYELNRAGRKGLEGLTDKIDKLNKKLNS